MNKSELPPVPQAGERQPAGTRRAPRIALSAPLLLRDAEGSAYPVEICNASAGGLQLRCDASTALRLRHPRAPQVFTAALPAGDSPARESLVGLRLRYLVPGPKSGSGVLGCDFVGLRPVAARRLQAMVAASGQAGAQLPPGDSGVEIGNEGAADARDLILQ